MDGNYYSWPHRGGWKCWYKAIDIENSFTQLKSTGKREKSPSASGNAPNDWRKIRKLRDSKNGDHRWITRKEVKIYRNTWLKTHQDYTQNKGHISESLSRIWNEGIKNMLRLFDQIGENMIQPSRTFTGDFDILTSRRGPIKCSHP